VKFETLFALSLLSLALTSSDAAINPGGGTWSSVTVVGVTACTPTRCPPKGWVIVQLSANASGNPPFCSSEHRDSVAIDFKEAGGAFAAQMLQVGLVTGLTFTVNGTGTCGVDAAIETAGTVTELSQQRNR
jgi:hypothetical protein